MKVFLSGIAGTGMSALAGLFKEKGDEVWGSDVAFYPPVDGILKDMKVKLFSPYKAENIPPDVDVCVIGNVIGRGNPEAEHILDNGPEYYSMAEALYRFFIKGKKSIVVAGTHGKTTITSFVAHLLAVAGQSPGFFIGGKPNNFAANYGLGSGPYFVSEGDEYETAFFDRSSKFLKYHPFYLIISALEYDHLDFFPDEKLYLKSFTNLVNQVPASGLIIVNNDFEMNRQVIKKAFTPVVTYGCGDGAAVLIRDIRRSDGCTHFTLRWNDRDMHFKTPLPGRYNLWNLAAGIILGLHLDFPPEAIARAVESFAGVERRFSIIHRKGNTVFIEDFAHHPTAIKGVISGVKELYPGKKIIVLFEPRSWSLRRNFFQKTLAGSFFDSDEVVIKEVFEKEKIPETERLDLPKIKAELEGAGKRVLLVPDGAAIREYILGLDWRQPQAVLLISNGSFDNLPAFIKNLS